MKCSGGTCVCEDLCGPAGDLGCDDSTHYKKCGNYDRDSCLEWSSPIACPPNSKCNESMTTEPPCTCTMPPCMGSDPKWFATSYSYCVYCDFKDVGGVQCLVDVKHSASCPSGPCGLDVKGQPSCN
jgi:hypothetical protein